MLIKTEKKEETYMSTSVTTTSTKFPRCGESQQLYHREGSFPLPELVVAADRKKRSYAHREKEKHAICSYLLFVDATECFWRLSTLTAFTRGDLTFSDFGVRLLLPVRLARLPSKLPRDLCSCSDRCL